MANSDRSKDSSYSSLNIIIIILATIMASYFIYTFVIPQANNQNAKTDYFDDLIEEPSEIVTQNTNEPANIIIEQSEPITFFDDQASATGIAPEVVINEKTTIEAISTPLLLIDTTEEIEDNYTDLLKASDQRITSTLAKFSQQTVIVSALLHDDILRNTVVFIENFSKGHFISKFSPMIAPKEAFVVQRKGKALIIDPRSYQRYDDYADYIYSVDSKAFVQYYQSLKPSIDDFYAEISKPNTTFDNALSKAISIVLATPIIYKEIEVESPSVMYLYNNDELENLNNAQKLLLRMGPKNLAKIKHKLRNIQAELTIFNQ